MDTAKNIRRAWQQANQQELTTALSSVREALEGHVNRARASRADQFMRCFDYWLEGITPQARPREASKTPPVPSVRGPGPAGRSALDVLCARLGLSAFERDLLLLCAGCELDAGFASLCALAQGDERRRAPTFSLALAALPRAHWSALNPTAPLRYYSLLHIGEGDSLTTSPLRIDEYVLHYLTGVPCLDTGGVFEHLLPDRMGDPVEGILTEHLDRLWQQDPPPIVQFLVPSSDLSPGMLSAASMPLGIGAVLLRTSSLSGTTEGRERIARLWERESLLNPRALILYHQSPFDDAARQNIGPFLDRVPGRVLVLGLEVLSLTGRALVSITLGSGAGQMLPRDAA